MLPRKRLAPALGAEHLLRTGKSRVVQTPRLRRPLAPMSAVTRGVQRRGPVLTHGTAAALRLHVPPDCILRMRSSESPRRRGRLDAVREVRLGCLGAAAAFE